MPDLSPDELMLLELDAAWESFCDENADSMQQLRELSEGSHLMLELAFKAGYTSGAGSQLRQIREARDRAHFDPSHLVVTCENCGAPLTAGGCSAGCFKKE